MATVKIDIIDGHRGRKDRFGWQELERVAKVSGLSAVGYAMLDAALLALASSGVTIGAAHPYQLDLSLDEMAPEAVGKDVVEVRLTYRRLPANEGDSTIEVGATVEQATANIDINGDPIKVGYDTDGVPEAADYVGAEISVLRPGATISVNRIEYASPGGLARQYVGKVNQANWDLDPAAAAGEWLCTGITGTSEDYGVSYRVSYSFQHKAGGWNGSAVVYLDTTTGRPPSNPDVKGGNGIEYPTMYASENFNALNLT